MARSNLTLPVQISHPTQGRFKFPIPGKVFCVKFPCVARSGAGRRRIVEAEK